MSTDKIRPLMILTILICAIIAQGQKKQVFKPIKKLLVDLNNDNKIDTIILSTSLDDIDKFNKISISISGCAKKSFVAKDVWTIIDNQFLSENKNSINSNLLFLKKTVTQSVILLFGILDGAGYRSEFSIINIEKNLIKMPFDHQDDIDVEVPVALKKLNYDGRLYFIFRGLGELYKKNDKLHADIGTYNPFFVYGVAYNCKLNKPLMKSYNQQYYVFAGYNYNEKVKIIYPKNGNKPKILNK